MPHYDDVAIPFGKFKGLPISEVEKYAGGKGYLSWLWRTLRVDDRIRLYIALCDLFEVSNRPDDPEQIALARRMEASRKTRRDARCKRSSS